MCSRDKFPAKSSKLMQEYIDLWTREGVGLFTTRSDGLERAESNYFCTVISKILVMENIFISWLTLLQAE